MSIDRKHMEAVRARSATVNGPPLAPRNLLGGPPQIDDVPSAWANYPGDTTHMGGEIFPIGAPFPQWGVLTTEYDPVADITSVGFGRIS